jgi:hypothetical protein
MQKAQRPSQPSWTFNRALVWPSNRLKVGKVCGLFPSLGLIWRPVFGLMRLSGDDGVSSSPVGQTRRLAIKESLLLTEALAVTQQVLTTTKSGSWPTPIGASLRCSRAWRICWLS